MGEPGSSNFQIACDQRGVATVWVDVPGRRYNTLTEQVLNELDRLVEHIQHDPVVRMAIFHSGKAFGFVAGADLREISALESAEAADRLAETGQTPFGRLQALQIPTIVVLHGPCLGGGLEFAMACRHRIARDDPSTRLGLPEVRLGLLPAWGGRNFCRNSSASKRDCKCSGRAGPSPHGRLCSSGWSMKSTRPISLKRAWPTSPQRS